jgi:hypothetical protein
VVKSHGYVVQGRYLLRYGLEHGCISLIALAAFGCSVRCNLEWLGSELRGTINN